jgi:hypothetical protein
MFKKCLRHAGELKQQGPMNTCLFFSSSAFVSMTTCHVNKNHAHNKILDPPASVHLSNPLAHPVQRVIHAGRAKTSQHDFSSQSNLRSSANDRHA